ncbi:MAG: helix-turn-helix transcriptional regulator, partial [Oscillospiraceae bacterium]|nr:helix-turn-helix transcriptional regulator [Oscillospiraceae bacterium]
MKISKELLKGSTSIMVLKVISEGDCYGYQIIPKITQSSGEVIRLNEGTLYPILHTMKKEGYLDSYRRESEAGRERKYYTITAQGKMHLASRMEEWRAYTEAVGGVLAGESV